VNKIRKRLTYANVMSSIAVFLVLGGATAFAATKIGPNEIKANSIKTGKIVKEAVTAGKIKKGAVTESRIANGAVTSAKLADNAVTTTKLANKSVTGAKLDLPTLGTVPNAQNAVNAQNANTVNKQSIASFFKEVPNNGPAATALEFGGVRITVTCTANKPNLEATNVSGQQAASRVGTIEETTEAHGNGLLNFGTLTLTNGKQLGTGNLEVVFANGTVTSVDFAWRDDAFNGAGCRFWGSRRQRLIPVPAHRGPAGAGPRWRAS